MSARVGQIVKVVGAFNCFDYLVGRVESVQGSTLYLKVKRFQPGYVEWSPAMGGYLEQDEFQVARSTIQERYGIVIGVRTEDFLSGEHNSMEELISDVLAAELLLRGK